MSLGTRTKTVRYNFVQPKAPSKRKTKSSARSANAWLFFSKNDAWHSCYLDDLLRFMQ